MKRDLIKTPRGQRRMRKELVTVNNERRGIKRERLADTEYSIFRTEMDEEDALINIPGRVFSKLVRKQ